MRIDKKQPVFKTILMPADVITAKNISYLWAYMVKLRAYRAFLSNILSTNVCQPLREIIDKTLTLEMRAAPPLTLTKYSNIILRGICHDSLNIARFSVPMGSERMEMRKRQMSVQQESVAGTTAPVQNEHPDQGNRSSNACCFCWCCCCSCTWNEDREERNRRASYDPKAEGNADFEESPKPTVEEVRSWGQSFDKLMHCPAGRAAFRQFLRTEFSEENMLFWLVCEEFRKETNKSMIEEKARVIYEDYISILSPKEVSLDSRVREVINRNMLEPTSHTFDDAQLQIYTLMQRDSYPRFMNTEVYKDLLKTVSEQPAES
ncbi:regulator of G-protein signaling 20 isoform X3 [Triplophysa rosa]|uniref:regulator of G-protein signaling 20 isoform X3 n=1 Tax=Triplophysa rosa TaxID=992332 RepID=UPI002545F9C5|nr:regulator of G-protein signaling 20 isoform X3 [Triplophysa rosa]